MTNSSNLIRNVWGMRFGMKLDELERAYRAARSEADRDKATVVREWNELEQAVARGEDSFTQEDEDGNLIWDAGDHAGELMHELDTALELVRQAFTISLHHFWERELNMQMNLKKYDENGAFALLNGQGILVQEDKLTALRLTANVAKHSEGSSADQLYLLRPDLFDAAEMARWSASPGYDYLRVSDHVLEDYFAAVRSSGPPRRKGWS